LPCRFGASYPAGSERIEEEAVTDAAETVILKSQGAFLKTKIMTKLGALILTKDRVYFQQNNPFIGPLLKIFGLGKGEMFNIPLAELAAWEQSSYVGNKDCIILNHTDGSAYKVSLMGGTWDQWNDALTEAKA
jgi:hypothetical protein